MPITRRKRANPPDQPESNNHLADQTENSVESLDGEQASTTPENGEQAGQAVPPIPEQAETLPFPSMASSPTPVSNGDRVERQEYTSSIESGRRTSRGELFRRPPQPPVGQPLPAPTVSTPPAPSHEISLPLGNLLHLAYNPSYTGSDEARSVLLQKLADESAKGGRARCWNCGSIAIAYDHWNTRNKTFGEVGIAYCEICGVWSVL
jgi:hypothetical protein